MAAKELNSDVDSNDEWSVDNNGKSIESVLKIILF